MDGEPAMIAARWVIGLLVFGGISAFTANRKGYAPGWWFLAGGCLGLLILAFLPNTKNNYMPREQKTRLRKRGNLVGISITSLAMILNVLLVMKVLSGK